MINAAIKALNQILSPPMRSILWRSIALALALITVAAIGLQRTLSWFATSGESWAEMALGSGFQTPLHILSWIVSIAAGLGVVLGAVFLMPAVTSLVAGFFVDDVADFVERDSYPAERPGTAVPFGTAMLHTARTAALTILVYLLALPFVFIAGAASSPSSSPPPGCSAVNISTLRRCASALPPRPRRCVRKIPARCFSPGL